MKMEQKKNNTLEILKLLAAYMVVFIHIPFYGEFGNVVDALARFAVPFFFVVSGFYSYEIPQEKIKKRISNIFRLFVFSAILYTIWNVINILSTGNADGLLEYFGRYLSLKKIFNFLVLNIPISSIHLWYLLATIYVYVIYSFVTKRNMKDSTIFKVCVVLLSINIILGEILLAFGVDIPVAVIRNFIFTGLPFFGLGVLAKKNETKLASISNPVVLIALIIGVLETVLSRNLFGINEIYIGTLFIIFALVVLFIKCADKKIPAVLASLAKSSTYIYVIHIFVISVTLELISEILPEYQVSVEVQMVRPLIVCVFSTVLACGMNWLAKKFSK